jgi:hypothetical protein
VQGLNCEGLKRNWAKIKEKGLNCKGFVSAGGYICKYWKTQGLFCKNTRAGWGLTGLTQLTRSRSIRSRSDDYGGLWAARAAELDLARRILIRRPRMLASGGAAGRVGRRWAAAELAGDHELGLRGTI